MSPLVVVFTAIHCVILAGGVATPYGDVLFIMNISGVPLIVHPVIELYGELIGDDEFSVIAGVENDSFVTTGIVNSSNVGSYTALIYVPIGIFV